MTLNTVANSTGCQVFLTVPTVMVLCEDARMAKRGADRRPADPDAVEHPTAEGRSGEPASEPDEEALEPEVEEELMTLDQLAELTGVAPRTIRFYQTKKLLQRPRKDTKDARLARYGPEHAERLRLIGELHDRGLKLPAIKNLLEEGDADTRIADWLGLDDTLRGAWNPVAPRLVERDELAALLSPTPPGTQGSLEDAGLIVRQQNAWLIANPALLDITISLIAEGVPTELILEAGTIIQRQLAKAADQVVDLFAKALRDGYGNGVDVATLTGTLRPVAGDAARVIFGQQLERAIEALLADTKRLGRR